MVWCRYSPATAVIPKMSVSRDTTPAWATAWLAVWGWVRSAPPATSPATPTMTSTGPAASSSHGPRMVLSLRNSLAMRVVMAGPSQVGGGRRGGGGRRAPGRRGRAGGRAATPPVAGLGKARLVEYVRHPPVGHAGHLGEDPQVVPGAATRVGAGRLQHRAHGAAGVRQRRVGPP